MTEEQQIEWDNEMKDSLSEYNKSNEGYSSKYEYYQGGAEWAKKWFYSKRAEQEHKIKDLRDLIDAQREYIETISDGYSRIYQFAYLHHYRERIEDIEKGKLLRDKIEELTEKAIKEDE